MHSKAPKWKKRKSFDISQYLKIFLKEGLTNLLKTWNNGPWQASLGKEFCKDGAMKESHALLRQSGIWNMESPNDNGLCGGKTSK